MKKVRMFCLCVGLCLAFLMSGIPLIGGGAQAASKKPEGTMTWGIHFKMASEWIDPAFSTAKTHPWIILYGIHDALVKSMPEGAFTPSLAESYSASKDGKTYEFKLRKGVTFQNGDPLTADDVKFSFERFRGQYSKLLKSKVESVEIVDPYLVRFHLKEPWNDFMEYYCGVGITAANWIVPKKYVEKVGDEEFLRHPIGAGPYRLVSHKPGVELVMEANENYWRKVPNVKTLVFKSITDRATDLAMLKAGEVDIAWAMKGNLGVEVEKDPNLTYLLAPSSGVIYLFITEQFNPQSPWSKLKVREAASLALDLKTIVDSTIRGAPILGQFMPADLLWVKTYPVPPYDPEKAKKLLAEAGYPKGFDGGTIYSDSTYADHIDLVATYWRNIGINVKVQLIERAAYYKKMDNHELKGIILDATSSGGSAATRLNIVLESVAGGYGHYPDIAELMKQQKVELDPEKRKEILYKIQDLAHEKQMILTLQQNGNATGIGPRVKEHMAGKCANIWFSAPLEDVELK